MKTYTKTVTTLRALTNTGRLQTVTVYRSFTKQRQNVVACVEKYLWTDGTHDYIRYENRFLRIRTADPKNVKTAEVYVVLTDALKRTGNLV